MIAMQYSFVLPADYDMSVIDRRIRDKGSMLDGFPHLRFKVYLSARRRTGFAQSPENLYAPFYLWEHPDGLSAFLCGPGFANLTRDFGWPVVRTWTVWEAAQAQDLSQARYASRDLESIPAHADLNAFRARALENARAASAAGALATVAGFNPENWTAVQFRLWRSAPKAESETSRLYDVGYVALP